jgi:hypothetical protein
MNFIEAESTFMLIQFLVFIILCLMISQNCFQYSHDVLPLSWRSDLIEGHEFLILRLQDRFMLSTFGN